MGAVGAVAHGEDPGDVELFDLRMLHLLRMRYALHSVASARGLSELTHGSLSSADVCTLCRLLGRNGLHQTVQATPAQGRRAAGAARNHRWRSKVL